MEPATVDGVRGSLLTTLLPVEPADRVELFPQAEEPALPLVERRSKAKLNPAEELTPADSASESDPAELVPADELGPACSTTQVERYACIFIFDFSETEFI